MAAWIKAYAAWLAIQVEWPRTIVRMKIAGACAKMTVTKTNLAALEAKPGFPELVEKYRHSELSRVRALFEQQLDGYLQDHRKGLDMALANKDYKAIPAFTTPSLERIWPKKIETTVASPLIQINVSGDVKRLLTNLPDAETEDVIEDAEYTLVERPEDGVG